MDLAIPFAVLLLLWIVMDPPQRYDSPYELIALTPKISLTDAMIERLFFEPGHQIPDGNYCVIMRLGVDELWWCQSELGYEPMLAHDRHHVNHILFHNDNDDDAMHFMMRWL